jgi:hypothetical protein
MSQTATKSINNVKAHSIWNIRSLTIMALMTALLIVSTYIKIPLPFSSASITAQTLMVNLIGLLLSPLQTLAVMVDPVKCCWDWWFFRKTFRTGRRISLWQSGSSCYDLHVLL